ncbi:hypothetical protein CKO31_00695 [Thiohalocapsa halophila]|uniref:Uncharacterized protein n=1 Tax=Thiohalocapsa halophila TaxID=69359 RepID=A0ABS1CBG3_9GAMM|nr:hypothetical protein [Thiohalocapsa halophila]MBK1629272.1 hypothetical protein [Thiohalocapsa halophila]
MSETQADCRRLPFVLTVLLAAVLVGIGVSSPQGGLFGLDAAHWSRALIFAGSAILALAYVDAFRSRCIRVYMTVTLPILALACAAPLAATERAAWGAAESLWINAAIVLVLLLVFLHFSLHTMPSDWRRGLTPARSALFGIALAAGGALYWEFRGGGAAAVDKTLPLAADAVGILLGAVLFWLMMRHRVRAEVA